MKPSGISVLLYEFFTHGLAWVVNISMLSRVQSMGNSLARENSNIPKSTLHDHLSGTSSKRYGGPPTVLTASEEKEIVR